MRQSVRDAGSEHSGAVATNRNNIARCATLICKFHERRCSLSSLLEAVLPGGGFSVFVDVTSRREAVLNGCYRRFPT